MRDTARSSPDRASEPKRSVTPRAPAEPMLELQRSVGNRAARAVLARDTAEADTKRETSIEISDLGRLPLLSYSFGASPAAGRRDEAEDRPNPDVHVLTESGAFTAKIMQAATSGRHFDTVVITGRGITITLKDAIVSGYSTGSGGDKPTDQWSLNYTSIEYAYGTGG